MDIKQINAAAEQFAEAHLGELSAELLGWQDTSVLPGARMRQLAGLGDGTSIAGTALQLARIHVERAAVAGRDIKGLLKLTVKFCRRRNVEFSVDTFRRCGQFRGLI